MTLNDLLKTPVAIKLEDIAASPGTTITTVTDLNATVLSTTFTSIKGNERNHSQLDELRKVEIKTIDGFQVHIVLIIHTFVFHS